MSIITQLSLFLQNEAGSLNKACQVLAKNGIDIITLSLADTREYGILRLLVRDREKAADLLTQAGFVVKPTPVLAVPVDNRPGGLAAILAALAENRLDVLYMYAFPAGKGGKAVMVFRFAEPEKAQKILADAGFATLTENEL